MKKPTKKKIPKPSDNIGMEVGLKDFKMIRSPHWAKTMGAVFTIVNCYKRKKKLYYVLMYNLIPTEDYFEVPATRILFPKTLKESYRDFEI